MCNVRSQNVKHEVYPVKYMKDYFGNFFYNAPGTLPKVLSILILLLVWKTMMGN